MFLRDMQRLIRLNETFLLGTSTLSDFFPQRHREAGHCGLQTKDVRGESAPSPLPPPRPERLPDMYHSTSLYQRTLPEIIPPPQADILDRSQTLSGYPPGYKTPHPVRPPPSPPRNKAVNKPRIPPTPVNASYDDLRLNTERNVKTGDGQGERAPSPLPPPRPERLPDPSLYHSTSQCQRTLPEIKPPPQTPARLQKPPSPSFTPPPPRPSGKTPSLPYQEPIYSEVEEPEYLEILPQENDDDEREINSLITWLRAAGCSYNMSPSLYGLSIEEETREFNQKAMSLKRALRLFNLLLIQRNDALRGLIARLTSICDSLDKMQKKTRAMSIAGGTTGAVGGVATVMGIILAPPTFGASLVATAIGAGMVASAGGMGAHAAMTSKKAVDKKTVKKIVEDYTAGIVDVERCLLFMHSRMDELRRHNLPRLQRAGAHPEALRVAQLSQSLFKTNLFSALGESPASIGGMLSERLLQAFTKELDLYFTEKNGQKLKKSSESKFSSRVGLLAQNLQEALEELAQMWEMCSRY